MSMKLEARANLARTVVTAILAAALAAPLPSLADDDDDDDALGGGRGAIERAIKQGKRKIAFEVAENGTRFVFDEAPVDANGFPLYGNPFITQGFIYPAGTLDPDDPARDGVIPVRDAGGNIVGVEPEFPDRLLGTWICYGTVFAQDGFNIASGPTVISTQLYEFTEVSGAVGKISLTSNGLELIDLGKEVQRAVIGGTGPFRKARGQVTQTFIGVNETEGFVLRFEADVR